MSVGTQMDGFAHTVRTFVADQGRHNAAVGLAITCIFLESNVATTTTIVGDKKDEILSYLSVHDVSIFVMPCIKTTVMKVAVWIVCGA